jgi:hypothetical protein
MKKETKILHTFIWLGLTFSFFFLAYIGYLLFYPPEIPRVEQPFKVLNENKEVRRGGFLLYEIIYIKNKPMTAYNNRYIECEDGSVTILASGSTNLPTGERQIIGTIEVPKVAPLEICQFKNTIEYKVNELRTKTVTYETEPFRIIE